MDTQTLEPRQQRGLAIAALCKLQKKGSTWLVPSQNGKGKYQVCADPAHLHCTCPDHATTGGKCKHIFAVEFTLRRKRNPDGSVTVTKTAKITERKTYPQDWQAYNAAQTNERDKFQELLFDLCKGIIDERQPGKRGRPRLLLGDAVFACAYKVYSTFSARRFASELRAAHSKGYLSKAIHFNSIIKAFENPRLTPILRSLITESSKPLAAVEVDFAADSSGFTSSRFIRWHDHKYGVVRKHHDWVKLHMMCGVKTNIVAAAEIRDRDASDTKLLPDLVNATAANFTMKEVSADRGYASINNTNVVASHNAAPYILFKKIHSGKGGGLWQKFYHYFEFNGEEFMEHYHKRSNAESTFSMIKAKFGDHLRSKTETAMVNEVYCKVLCHNICVLIQEIYELGIQAQFWKEEGEQGKVG